MRSLRVAVQNANNIKPAKAAAVERYLTAFAVLDDAYFPRVENRLLNHGGNISVWPGIKGFDPARRDERTMEIHMYQLAPNEVWGGTVEPGDADRINQAIANGTAGPNYYYVIWDCANNNAYLGSGTLLASLAAPNFALGPDMETAPTTVPGRPIALEYPEKNNPRWGSLDGLAMIELPYLNPAAGEEYPDVLDIEKDPFSHLAEA